VLADVGHAVAARLGRDSAAAAVLSPVYSWCLGKACGRRGLAWRVNGESMRIDPAVRHLLPHDNEPELFAFLRDRLEPGQIVLDIGAFLGTYAILEARRVGPAGRVIAFEPSPSTFAVLERHLRMNGLSAPQVDARCAAVGARSGPGRLMTWDDEPYRNMVAPDGTAGLAIASVTLDGVCAAWTRLPDWIRMDVQGQEFEVLRGARELLRAARGRLRIVAEMHPEQWPDYGISPSEAGARFADLGLRARALSPGREPFVQSAHAILEAL
jgi:FkbM family methyltransferase